MSQWKVPEKKNVKTNNYHELALKFCRSYLLQMGERGRTDEQIQEFVKNPSQKSMGLADDPNSSSFFNIIKNHSTFAERMEILKELVETEQL